MPGISSKCQQVRFITCIAPIIPPPVPKIILTPPAGWNININAYGISNSANSTPREGTRPQAACAYIRPELFTQRVRFAPEGYRREVTK